MTQQVDIQALAQLARLEVSEEELARLQKELPHILSFVEEVQKASAEVPKTQPALRNVMRDDANPHESGLYTEKILAAAPAREKDRVAVKQVMKAK